MLRIAREFFRLVASFTSHFTGPIIQSSMARMSCSATWVRLEHSPTLAKSAARAIKQGRFAAGEMSCWKLELQKE
jgi:hypothetical protein